MLEWAESCISEDRCRELVELGYMPEKSLIGWRPAAGDAVPAPNPGEVVVFAPFFERGFSVPTHPFFRRLLDYYGLQLHHLNPNGILHISIFITLCEAYLGIEPHLGLWKWLYRVKAVSKLDRIHTVGGVYIQLRSRTPYVSIPLRTSNKSWHSRWFYCRNERPSLPDFVADHCPVKLPSWSNLPTADEMAEVEKIMPHLNDLIQDGLDGADLIATFLSRRIQPIKKRCHRMSEFTGNSDPTRETPVMLPEDEVFSRAAHLVSTDTEICTRGKPLPYHHKRPVEHDLSKYLSVTLEEEEEGAMQQATDSITLVNQPPLNKPNIPGASSSGVSVQQKAKEVVTCSCNELAQQRESGNRAPISQLPPDDEDTTTLPNRKKREPAEALACSTIQPDRRKKLSKDVMLPCLLPHSSALPAKEVSASASSQAADLTIPHRKEMAEGELVPLSPPHAASPSPTPQSEPCPLQSPPVSLPTLTAPESIEMLHVPCRPLPFDNLGSSQQSVGIVTDSVEVEGEVHGKKAEKEPGMLSVQMKDAESKVLWVIDDETRLAEINIRFKCASEMIVKLQWEKKELEVKLKEEIEVARAFEKKASDLSRELDIVRADRDFLSRRFQDAKKKAAAFDAIHATCDKFSVDNLTPNGVAAVTERLSSFFRLS